MRRPTQKERDEAREYLLLRADAVRSMARNWEALFDEAVERIVAICFRHHLRPEALNSGNIPRKALAEIDAVVDWLYETALDYAETLVEAAPDGDEALWLWARRERAGMTLEQRLRDYCEKFRLEIFLLTAAGIAVGLGSVPLVESLLMNKARPWVNPALRDGLARVPSYGVGRSNAMFNAGKALTADAVAGAWMRAKYLRDERRGALGWWVERGSSVPCDVCDPQTGFHFNSSSLPLYHLSCMCLATPVFSNDKNNF